MKKQKRDFWWYIDKIGIELFIIFVSILFLVLSLVLWAQDVGFQPEDEVCLKYERVFNEIYSKECCGLPDFKCLIVELDKSKIPSLRTNVNGVVRDIAVCSEDNMFIKKCSEWRDKTEEELELEKCDRIIAERQNQIELTEYGFTFCNQASKACYKHDKLDYETHPLYDKKIYFSPTYHYNNCEAIFCNN